MERKQKAYREQGIDLKRLVLVLGRKMWLIAIGAVVGALLGGLTYKVVTNITNGEPEYRATADYYITFFGEGVHYFNAYTWDNILRDDPIVDYALTLLPDEITKDMVKDAVTGEMLGDYRILTVHVNAKTKETANLIAQAYEKSLWNFSQEMELLDEVVLWSQDEAIEFEKNNKTMNAAFLGALIAVLLVVFCLLFYYVLEDACYVERDGEERFGLPVYGMITKEQDAKQQEILKHNLIYVFGKAEVETWNGEIMPDAQDFARLREVENLLIGIPWGRNNGRQVERVLHHLKLQDCDVKGIVITEAEDSFVKAYYAVEHRRNRV